ncbi:hypothetical protein PV325_001351 [Microctonus aethiopoides]|uniref:ZP domain-containing protein n=2 Tax=Microctonus aethiopoides TaxID=144406 RepID=A0AA39KWV6_9HYME|nr:hypothetical protein PV325_001351 [Microctonus aethiopoides]KAK0087591.1 hypothetical protein PV326_005130 [Microctonus aethiopoides]KAK0176546.1 hypothetical protein PV328_000671 [Microctonus aethiopoides]
MLLKLLFNFSLSIILFVVFISSLSAEEIWEHDLSENMKIGASTEGYDRVGLRCGAESMTIELKTTDNFSGVIYTQGSFHSRKSPCFIDPVRGRSFTMNIPLHKCETEQEGDRFSNIIVVQHDDELVTPGDAAFNLECDFSSPRDLTVTADLNGGKKKSARASIALLDADPGRDRRKRAAFVKSDTDEVTFIPNDHRKGKDEL